MGADKSRWEWPRLDDPADTVGDELIPRQAGASSIRQRSASPHPDTHPGGL